MAFCNNVLPFARGQTYFGIGPTDTISADQSAAVQHLTGKRYMVNDPDYDGLPVELMIVQYDGTGSLTADELCVDFTDANSTTFSDLAPGANGDVAYPLDHKYAGKTIRDLDLCYVVTWGPCEVTGGATVSAGEPVMAETSGEVIASTAAGNFNVGMTIDAAADGVVATVFVGLANKAGQ